MTIEIAPLFFTSSATNREYGTRPSLRMSLASTIFVERFGNLRILIAFFS
jgi:hypothetical protein